MSFSAPSEPNAYYYKFTCRCLYETPTPREVAEHTLRVIPGSKPAKQRLCHFDDERRRAIGEEIAKLLAVGFIKEVYHSDWLANPVLMKKEEWKIENMC